MDWVEEERSAATVYLRLTRAAPWFEDGTAGLWRDPELGLGLKWRRGTPADGGVGANATTPLFGRAMRFLEHSERERDGSSTRGGWNGRASGDGCSGWPRSLALLLFLSGVNGYVATRQSCTVPAPRKRARRAQPATGPRRGRTNRCWSSSANQPGSAWTCPRSAQFRRELLEKAQRFYLDFIAQAAAERGLAARDGRGALQARATSDRALDRRRNARSRTTRRSIKRLRRRWCADLPGPPRLPPRAGRRRYSWLGEAAAPRRRPLRRGESGLRQRAGPRTWAARPVAATELAAQQQALAQGPLQPRHPVRRSAEPERRRRFRGRRSRSPRGHPPARAARPRRTRHSGAQDLGARVQQPGQRGGTRAHGRSLPRCATFYDARGAHPRGPDPARAWQSRVSRIELVKFYEQPVSEPCARTPSRTKPRRRNSQARPTVSNSLARPAPSLGIEQADSVQPARVDSAVGALCPAMRLRPTAALWTCLQALGRDGECMHGFRSFTSGSATCS